MKNTNKKGFTIIELVIVIAVIAILAAVLIPTFSGIIEKANKSSAEQAARNAYMEYASDGASFTGKVCVKSGDYYVYLENSAVKTDMTTKDEPVGFKLGDIVNTDYVCAEIVNNKLVVSAPAETSN